MAIANTSAVLDSLFLAVGSMALYRHRGHNRRHFILFQEAGEWVRRGNARGRAPSARRSDGPGKHLATKKSKPKLTSASHSDPAPAHELASACMRRAKKAAAGYYRVAAFCVPVTAARGPLYLWARSESASLAGVRMALAGTRATNGLPDLSI